MHHCKLSKNYIFAFLICIAKQKYDVNILLVQLHSYILPININKSQCLLTFLKVVRNEIDEINAGAHDNMTYEEIAKEMITQIIFVISINIILITHSLQSKQNGNILRESVVKCLKIKHFGRNLPITLYFSINVIEFSKL